MAAENDKAILAAIEFEAEEIDLDDLEQSLQSQLEGELGDLDFLQEECEHINDPDHLGETVMNVVWEQFLNQVAVTAGEDFIKENGGLKLDLRDEAHIQTTENFEQGVIATHNKQIDYQARYDQWQDNFQKDEQGSIKVDRDGQKVLKNKKHDGVDARADFDKDRPKGSAAVHKDHTISAAEIIRDPEAAAHLSREEQVAFANSDKNLGDLDASANESKGDCAMTDWLDSERNGEKPADRFNIDEEELRERDRQAREEYDKQKEEGKQRSIETGKQSQKAEFYRIGKKALRTALMTLLATLLKEIIGKLVLWFKSAGRSLNTLTEHIKTAVKSFVGKLKELLVSTTDSVLTTIATSIIGPVVGTIKKVIMLLKQGWRSLKEAVQYLRRPENRSKPLSYLLPQVGIIVVTGLSGVGAIALGEFIEKALIGFPFLAVDIPLLGSPANLIGTLMGAIVCGVIGAIAINLINQYIANQQRNDNLDAQIDKKNDILATQDKLLAVKGKKLNMTQQEVLQDVTKRHREAGTQLTEILESVLDLSVAEAQDLSNEELDRLLQDL